MWWCSAVGFIITLTLSMLVALCTVTAQPRSAIPRIGILTLAAEASTPVWEAFRQGLRDLGYVEGKNISLEYCFAAGKPERLSALAAELVRDKVDMIVTTGGAAAQAARDATKMIPIVMATSGDPVRSGLVASLAQPGGNLTGLSLMVTEVGGKRLELLKEALPNHALAVRSPDELDSTFAAMTKEGAEALITLADAVLWNHRTRVVALASQHRLPAVFDAREFADAGGLMAYGPHVPDNYRRAAVYVDKILKGIMPADLPVEQPTKFELVVNLKTAQALGLTIPPALLFQADEVIR